MRHKPSNEELEEEATYKNKANTAAVTFHNSGKGRTTKQSQGKKMQQSTIMRYYPY